ncbi:bifunctional ADP-dependent NAD(P)H-hydrate dehydratase/NAD(P)H-hydrate epimerase [Actinomyces sp. 594]|uniref:bifunctional ADP-dependent NAD(P)H-hydrate dehydratase/NAD(P)H-hydrate epimerase n=1 Tax=Actinomyces sp. 594 TaxID=2057793 RepID=UPI001C59E0B4|nr:bifunctional ADP-dependent NAD(P)H-hydrate dehydratase/NAD(P)H-hydrate epimerase [Actinomyces sp. 594]
MWTSPATWPSPSPWSKPARRGHDGAVNTAPRPPAPDSTSVAAVAYPARAVAGAEAPLTAGTDRYMHAAAGALARAAVEEIRAARGAVPGARVLLLVGGGHNGGDALIAGALLARRGCAVTAAPAAEISRLHVTALAAARAAGVRLAADPRAAARAAAGGAAGADLVIDGLTGIGATGPLRPAAAGLIAPLRAAGEPGERPFRVLAVDLPSGVGVDDGTLPGPVLDADRTITFTCFKAAHLLPPAASLCGRVEVADLGLPVPDAAVLARRPADAELGRLLRVPGDQDHKYTRGVVGLWAGSQTYPGAAVLAASAAVRTGAGMVRLAAPARVVDLVLARRPEVVPADGRCQALVIGPGTDPADAPRAAELDAALGRVLGEAGEPVDAVIDAGALPLLAARVASGGRCSPRHVLTPHAGEAAALLGALGERASRDAVEAAPAAAARRLVELTGATVLLKTTPTLIASPGGTLLSVHSGPGWLATAGSGDVLAGIVGALLAAGRADADNDVARGGGGAGAAPASCAALGVRLHALAAMRAAGLVDTDRAAHERAVSAGAGRLFARSGHPLAALDLTEALPAAWEQLWSAGQRPEQATA